MKTTFKRILAAVTVATISLTCTFVAATTGFAEESNNLIAKLDKLTMIEPVTTASLEYTTDDIEQVISKAYQIQTAANAEWYKGSWHYETYCGYCTRFVVDSFYYSIGKGESSAYGNASQMGDRMITSTNLTETPPRGAVVFYDYYDDGVNYGHIGISLGDGTYISAVSTGIKVYAISSDFGSNYLVDCKYVGWGAWCSDSGYTLPSSGEVVEPITLTHLDKEFTTTTDSEIDTALSLIYNQNNNTVRANRSKKDMISYLLHDSQYAVFGGEDWPVTVDGDSIASITDNNLAAIDGTTTIGLDTSSWASMSYAWFASGVTYTETISKQSERVYFEGNASGYNSSTLQSTFENDLQAGEHLRVSDTMSMCYISCDDEGFYYLQYGSFDGSDPHIRMRYSTYTTFVKWLNATGKEFWYYTIDNDTNDTKSVSNLAVTAIADQTYTGSAIKPTVTVMEGSNTLVNGTNYTVSYSNNTNVGTATVTITGLGKFTGTKSITFKILPKAPTISSVTQAKGKITISWNAVDGATSYKVYRATSATGTKTLLKSVSSTSCTDTTATFGNTYYYFVHAYNSTGNVASLFSGYKSLKFTSLAPPTLNSVTASGNTVNLSWSAVPNATSYRVYRGTSATGAKSLLKTVSTTSCNNTSVTAGSTYYYYVVAYSSKTGTMSAASNTKSVTITNNLSAPTISSVTQAKGQINISWNAVSGATSYKVYRATSATGTKTLLKTVGITSCNDTTASLGTTYYYFVQAYSSKTGASSAYSGYKSLKFTSLAPPTLNSVTVSGNTVNLKWSAVPGATSYRVYRGTSATGAKTLLKTVSTTSCNNTSVTAGTTYYYYVVAYSSKTGTMSAASNTKSVTVKSTIAAPTLNSILIDGNTITLKWSAVSGATSYRVYRATSATGTKSLLKTVGITSCNDTTTVAGGTYYYFVAAYNSGTGALSNYSNYKAVIV